MLLNTTNVCFVLLMRSDFVIKYGGPKPKKMEKAHSLNLRIISTKLQLMHQLHY